MIRSYAGCPARLTRCAVRSCGPSRLHRVVGCMITYEGTGAIPRIPVHGYVISTAGVRVDHLYDAGPLDDLAGQPGVDLPGGQERQGPVGVLRTDDREHPDAHVERALHLALVDP